MNYDLVLITLLIIAVVVPGSVYLLGWPGPVASFVALVVSRTGVMAAGAVLVVVTVPLLSSSGPGFEGNAVKSFVGALFVVAICLVCERYAVVRDADDTGRAVRHIGEDTRTEP